MRHLDWGLGATTDHLGLTRRATERLAVARTSKVAFQGRARRFRVIRRGRGGYLQGFMMPDSQTLGLLIAAMVAGVICFRLYTVLGRKTGHEPPPQAVPQSRPATLP